MSKVYSWRKLNEKELTRVYLDEMRRDFPPTELKPLSMILNSEADGTAHTWGVFDGETLAAYLLMVRPAGSRVSQLDYFAVLPEYRSAGLGAQLLADLPQHERGAQAILIEAECPEKAEDEESVEDAVLEAKEAEVAKTEAENIEKIKEEIAEEERELIDDVNPMSKEEHAIEDADEKAEKHEDDE